MNTRYLRQETKEAIKAISETAIFEDIKNNGTVKIEYKDKTFIIFQLADGSLADNVYIEYEGMSLEV